jgi:beta-xylosidase
MLSAGEHRAESDFQLQWPITDGFDLDEDGVPDEYSGSWERFLQITVGGPTIFRDDFSGPTLDSAWSWLNEVPTEWSLTARPGFLRILTNDLAEGTQNLLVQSIPVADFEVRTRVLFEPSHNYQKAGLVLWQDADNYLWFGRMYCDAEPPVCVGNGIYFDFLDGGTPGGGNFGTTTSSQDEAYLRMVRQGSTYTGYYSEDGVNWTSIGSHTPSGSVALWGIGLTAGADSQDARIPADFDFFELSQD